LTILCAGSLFGAAGAVAGDMENLKRRVAPASAAAAV